MKLTLIAIYFVYIMVGVCLRYSFVKDRINKFKPMPDELYSFISKLLIFLGGTGLVTYVILTLN